MTQWTQYWSTIYSTLRDTFPRAARLFIVRIFIPVYWDMHVWDTNCTFDDQEPHVWLSGRKWLQLSTSLNWEDGFYACADIDSGRGNVCS